MKKLLPLLLLLLLPVPVMAQPKTNVILGWQDTNNFRMGLVSTNGTVLIPAVTTMVYHVFASTNLLTPPRLWPVVTNVTAANPGTNLITAVVSAREVAQFFTVTASDPWTGAESDFSNWTGLNPVISPVRTGIFPLEANP